MIRFSVPFVAAFQRPRPGKNGGYYSPHSKVEKQIGMLALAARSAQRASIVAGDVRFTLTVYCPWGKKGLKRDLSNVLKLVEDACNGVLYVDDAQIKDIRVQSIESDDERLEVEVESL